MATNYKNIVITPNRDTGAANVPVIRFSGGDATLNTDINLRVYTTQSGTLSFEGSAGQLFSITNDLTGSIFSVNDVSGIPSLEVFASGQINLAPYGGNVVFGNTSVITTSPIKINTYGASSATRSLTIKDATTAEINFGSYAGAWTSSLQIQNNDNSDFIWMSPLDNGLNARIRTGGSGLDFYTDGANDAGTFSAFIGSGSVRSPIFYDSDNSTYYVDPASTSDAAVRIRGGAYFGPNVSWSEYLYVGGNGRVGTSATVAVTNGNLHLDSKDGFATYLNWYSQGNVYTGTSTNLGLGSNSATQRLHVHGTGLATTDFRAPIFYDSDNTAYYTDPASTSNLNGLTVAATITGKIQYVTEGIALNADNYMNFRVMRNINTSAANDGMYIGYGNTNSGVTRIYGGGSTGGEMTKHATYTEEPGSFRAPIFYDSGNTAYYTDPAGTSVLNSVYVYGGFGGVNATSNYYDAAIEVREYGFGGAQTDSWAYAPRIGFHWSGRVASQIGMASSGRISILNNPANAYEAFECGNFFAPIFYDSNNTAYYVDPASTSNLNTVQAVDAFRSDRFEDLSGNFFFREGLDSGTTRHLNLSDSIADPSSISADVGISWGQRTDNNPYYLIWTSFYNNGISSHSRLRLGWHTGVEIGGATNYGGIRFFDNAPGIAGTSELMSIGKSDAHVRVVNNLYSKIYYDIENTTYYVDPASTSNLNIVNAVDFNSTSDIRFKRDINKIKNALDKVNQLNGYTFTLTETNQKAAGLIAQEVEKVLPEAVRGTEHKKMLAYDNVIGLLVEAIKEQNKKIEHLEMMINKTPN